MMKPFFSIIVPVYKVENNLDECVQSVLAQDFADFELILVDDGSPDNCPQMVDDYAQKDGRVRAVHKENGGLSSARNAGLAVAKGEYLLFLDSDDYWCCKDSLSSIRQSLVGNDVDLLIYGMKKYFQRGNRYTQSEIFGFDGRDVSWASLMKNNLFFTSACDKVYKRKVLQENQLNFVVGQLSEDIEWCIKLLQLNPSVAVLKKEIYVYRQQEASISHTVGRKNLVDISDTIKRYANAAKKDGSEDAVLHFLANQYVLWLTVSNVVKKKEIKDLLSDMKAYWFLLDYDLYPYVAKARKVKCLGFSIVRRLLKIYQKIKNKG